MKGVILAGGMGSRLRPLTLVTNKHLLPVYDAPMIFYPIRCLLNAGIDEIIIVKGREHADDFFTMVGDGKDLGIKRLEFACQDGEGGIAEALKLAEDFIGDQKMCVILGDNIIEGNIRRAADGFGSQESGAKLLLKEVPDPERFGVVRMDGNRIVEIIEKPTDPPSNLAVTGIYFYDSAVFEMCKSLKPSARGELEITDVNNAYLERGDLTWDSIEGWWTDAGTFESLHKASVLVADGGANHTELPHVTKPSASL